MTMPTSKMIIELLLETELLKLNGKRSARCTSLLSGNTLRPVITIASINDCKYSVGNVEQKYVLRNVHLPV